MAGKVDWDLDKTTPVTQGTSYKWTFKPTDTAHYNNATGSAILWEKSAPAPLPPSGGGGGAPMPEIPPKAPAGQVMEIEVTIPKGESSTTVVVPMKKKPTVGTVAVLVKPDGSHVVIKNSVITNDGISFVAETEGKYQIVDNSKVFDDVVANDWYKEAVDYVSARELFAGVEGGKHFAPWETMTRGMLVTVLHRFEDGNTEVGDGIWYEPGKKWAMESGLSDGSAMEQELTREQLVTILYRYAGKPKSQQELSSFPDQQAISAYAVDAARWAVEHGLLQGRNGGQLDPQSNANRAEVAAVLMRFVQSRSEE